MTSSEKAPRLSFECPKLWQDMPGSEEKRFCDSCGHHVQNLSLLDDETRDKLLKRAKSERICGTYFQDLEGNLITAESETSLAAKLRALRLASLAGGAVALASCSSDNTEQKPVPPQGSESIQLLGIMCPPEENHAESAIPTTGPSRPAHPDSIFGGMMENHPKTSKE